MQCVVAPQLELPLRQAAAIQFKNLVLREWDPEEDDQRPAQAPGAPPHPALPDADKAMVRANMLEAVVQAPPLIRAQLGVALRTMLEADYPERWPGLLPQINACLLSSEAGRLYGGLFCLRMVCRKYEYKDVSVRPLLHAVVVETLPQLQRITQGLLALNSTADEVAELLKLVLKTLWSCVYMDVPPSMQQPDTFHGWMTMLGALIELQFPAGCQPVEDEDRQAWPWWKTKKWAFRICNRLFSRYSTPKSCRDVAHKAFAVRFKSLYSCSLLQSYLRQLSSLTQGAFLPDRVLNYALQLLEHAVPKPAPYRILQPALPAFLFQVVFPLLCFSQKDALLWEEDPHEYIRKGYDIIEDMYSPRTAAMSFLCELLRVRGGDQLHPFLSFLVSVLHRCGPGTPPETRPYGELDGALYALGSLYDLLKRRPPYCDQLEGMLVAHVLPEFGNARGHLRAKACWVAGVYADTRFQQRAHFTQLMERVVHSLRDPELPVRVDAVVALRAFVDASEDVTQLRAILPHLLDELFKLMAEVDNEDLVFTLEAIVEKFGDEMAPYAQGLIQNLVASFWRALAAADEEGDGDNDGSGALACLGCLRTVATVLDAVSAQPSLYPQLEAHLMPLLQRMLSSEGQDVYEEVLDILAYLTYYTPRVSDALWSLFPVLVGNVREWGLDYFAETLTALDNLVSRDTQRFLTGTDAQGVRHVDALFSLVQHVLGSDQYEDDDCVCAPQLLAIVLQHCRGQVDPMVEPALRLVAARLEGDTPAVDPFFRDTLLLVWANSLYYNPALALAAAQRCGALPVLFRAWHAALQRVRKSGKRAHFKREQDKKLCVLGLTSLLTLPPGQAPPEVEATHGTLVQAVLQLLSELKVQREQRLKQEAEEGDGDEEESEEEEEYGGVEDEDEDEAAPQGGQQPSGWGQSRRQLAGAGGGAPEDEGSDDDDSQWSDYTEEEDGASGPLDSVDPWCYFTDALQHLQQHQPQKLLALRAQLDFPAQAGLAALGEYAQLRRTQMAAERAAELTAGAPSGV